MADQPREQEAPEFQSADSALLWVELNHLNEASDRIERQLTKMNGRVTRNSDWRLTSSERWRIHEKEHDGAKRNGTIISGVLSAAAFVGAVIAQALGIKIQ